MRALVRSELFKQRTSRGILQLPLWMTGLVVLVLVVHLIAFSAHDLASAANQPKLYGWGTGIGSLFAALLGALTVTSEIRHGTIRPTLLITPNRGRVIAAKATAGALGGLLIGLLAETLAVAITSVGLGVRDVHITLSAGELMQLLGGGALAAGLWGVIGTGVGAIVKNQVGTIVGLCVWLLLIESSLLSAIPSVAKFAPGASAGALAGMIQPQGATKLLAAGFGALLLIAYATAATLGGSITTTHRDVT